MKAAQWAVFSSPFRPSSLYVVEYNHPSYDTVVY